MQTIKKFNVFGTIGEGELIEWATIQQMEKACSIPPVIRGAILPDGHVGYGIPVGAVADLEEAVSPSYVGYDKSCMMYLTLFDLDVQDFMNHRENFAKILREETHFGLGPAQFKGSRPRQHKVMADERWNLPSVKPFIEKAANQLGSSGGGNHFADLVIFENGRVGLLTHSGSRGTGHSLATYFMKLADEMHPEYGKGYGWLDMDTDLGKEYWEAMQLMGKYALANHELISEQFSKSAGLGVTEVYWNRHNFVWKEDGYYRHRKGATPAGLGSIGIIPGSSGTPSYLVRGLGNPDSLQSSSHGAGRPYSRSQAKKVHDPELFNAWMANADILHFGLAPDETFMAYKDIESVIGEQEGILIQTIERMYPSVVIMGGKADDGD